MSLEIFIKAYNDGKLTLCDLKEIDQITNWLIELNTAKSWTYLGMIKSTIIRYDMAIDCFKKAISIDPEYSLAYRELLIVNPKSMTTEQINKMLNMPECCDYYSRCVRELNGRGLIVANPYTLGKNYATMIIPKLKADHTWFCFDDMNPFFNIFMDQKNINISKIL